MTTAALQRTGQTFGPKRKWAEERSCLGRVPEGLGWAGPTGAGQGQAEESSLCSGDTSHLGSNPGTGSVAAPAWAVPDGQVLHDLGEALQLVSELLEGDGAAAVLVGRLEERQRQLVQRLLGQRDGALLQARLQHGAQLVGVDGAAACFRRRGSPVGTGTHLPPTSLCTCKLPLPCTTIASWASLPVRSGFCQPDVFGSKDQAIKGHMAPPAHKPSMAPYCRAQQRQTPSQAWRIFGLRACLPLESAASSLSTTQLPRPSAQKIHLLT